MKLEQGITKAGLSLVCPTRPPKPSPQFPVLQGPETKGRSKLCQPDQGSFIGGVLLPIVNGKHMAWNVYAKAEEKCEEKLAELITEIKQEIAI